MEREKLSTDVSGPLLRKVTPGESCWSVKRERDKGSTHEAEYQCSV